MRKKINLSTVLLIIVTIVIILMILFIFKLNNYTKNISNTNNFVSKIDSTKDWVYDADYPRNVISNSYSSDYNTFYSKDIVVPYINICSSYASNSNNIIREIFDDAIKNYNNATNNSISDKNNFVVTNNVTNCSYKKYINDTSLSVILTYTLSCTDVAHTKYYTYNVNLKTGNQLSYEQIYNIAGFNSSNISTKVENAITEIMKEKMSYFSSNNNYPKGTNFDTYNNESINNYRNSVNSNTLKYFLSDNKKLNIIVKLNIPAGTGEFDTIITIE